MQKIANAIGVAGLKAAACITGIIIGGRTLLRPLYRAISNVGNQEIFAATTLLVVMGTSVLTQIAGLSLALGAFLVCRGFMLRYLGVGYMHTLCMCLRCIVVVSLCACVCVLMARRIVVIGG